MASLPPTPVPKLIGMDVLKPLVSEAIALESAIVAFTALSTEGAVQQPPVMSYEMPDDEVEVHVKGAHLAGQDFMAVKMANGGYLNQSRGDGVTGSGLVLVVDVKTGYPAAVLLDNAWLTDMRTAAAGALASSLLCTAGSDGTLAIVGSGVQAMLHARSVTAAMPGRFGSIRFWSRQPSNAVKLAAEMTAELEGLGCSAHETVEEAVAGADLVVCVTASKDGLVEASWLPSNATIVALGSDGVGKRELCDSVLTGASLLVCDKREQCGKLGELQYITSERLATSVELGDIVVGKHPARTATDRLVVVDLTGCGAQDAAIAGVVWSKLRTQSSL